MEIHAKPPEPLSADGDMSANWLRWLDEFKIFMIVTGYNKKPKDVIAYILRNQIGKVGRDAIEEIEFDRLEDKENIDILVTKLDEHFNPPKSEIIERYNFFTRCRGNNETLEMYIEDLKKKAKTCNFGDMADSLIRDRVISEIKDGNLRKKLFSIRNLDIPTLISTALAHRIAVQQEQLPQHTNPDIEKNKNVNNTWNIGSPNDMKSVDKNSTNNEQSVNYQNRRPCWRCNLRHPIKRCPAWGHKCLKCDQFHHYTYCCRNAAQTNEGKPTNTDKNVSSCNTNSGKDHSKTNTDKNVSSCKINSGKDQPKTSTNKNVSSCDTNSGKNQLKDGVQQKNISHKYTKNVETPKGSTSCSMPFDMQPSAPDLSQFGSNVYPNLQHVKQHTQQKAMPDSWVMPETKKNENIQKNTPPTTGPTGQSQGNVPIKNMQYTNTGNHFNSKKPPKAKQDDCVIS